jgi:hypothetical protein
LILVVRPGDKEQIGLLMPGDAKPASGKVSVRLACVLGVKPPPATGSTTASSGASALNQVKTTATFAEAFPDTKAADIRIFRYRY